MKSAVLIFAALLFGLPTAHADIQSYELFHTENTDNFRLTHFRAASASGRYDLVWPYQNEAEKIHFWNFSVDHGFGDDFHYSQLSAGYFQKFSKQFSVDAHIGAFQFRNSPLDKTELTSSYGINATVIKNEKLNFQTSLDRSFLIEEAALSSDLSNPIWALSAKENLVWRSSEKWKHEAAYRHRWIENENSRDDIELSSIYGVSVFPNWIMVGATGTYTSFRERSASYWSPQSVSMLGLKFDCAIPFRDDFAFKVGGVVGPAKEVGASSTISNYVKVAISHGPREGRDFEFYVIDSRSTRSTGEWSAQTVGVSYNSKF